MVSRTGLNLSKTGQTKAEKAQAKSQKATDEKKALIQENKQLMKELAALRKQAAPVDTAAADPKPKRARAKKTSSVVVSQEALSIPADNDTILVCTADDPLKAAAASLPVVVVKCFVTECTEDAEPTITAACKHAFCSLHGPHCDNHIGHPLSNRTNPCVLASDAPDETSDDNLIILAKESSNGRYSQIYIFIVLSMNFCF